MTNIEKIKEILKEVEEYNLEDKVNFLNAYKQIGHAISPFKNEPVDLVLWVKNERVESNDYNPNKVAPPEMQLLEVSIDHDGYTQPIVAFSDENKIEVVDGFHRSRVGKESPVVNKRVHGYLPIVSIREGQTDKKDRIASTIRHNRARGKHQVDAMSEIVQELKNRNWNNKRIARELGMEEDEILRLCQISGLESLFSDADFSKAWIAEDSDSDFQPLDEEFEDSEDYGKVTNTNDPERIFHTYDKWECAKSNFYKTTVDNMTTEEAKQKFANFFKEKGLFEKIANIVIVEWKNSCEHYLTNKSMNRIAWLGQASVCYHTGIPSKFSSGWFLLSEDEQNAANKVALTAINKWMKSNNRDLLSMDEALSVGRQVEIY